MSIINTSANLFYARWTLNRAKAQLLREHLIGVAELATQMAKSVRPSDTLFSFSANIGALLHDLGKYRPEFQSYLNAGNRTKRSTETDHAVYGAAAALEFDSLEVAFSVAGHHAGLHDLVGLQNLIFGSKYHAEEKYPRLMETADQRSELAGFIASINEKQQRDFGGKPFLLFNDADPVDKRRFEVFIRMLFSILVDADRLDSERFEQEHRLGRSWQRQSLPLEPVKLLSLLDAERERCEREAEQPASELNRMRGMVYQTCCEVGTNASQGFFTLTVPTGGGKTLSSMAFALSHARRHNLRRVIIVIPYLSIIEQNAEKYRQIFGASQVLEHQSAVEVQEKPSDKDIATEPAQVLDVERSMENWDVPIIVTTSVQFLETLFAAKTGRARKLHNIAQSVVVFDEVQTMPMHLLEPTLDMLRTLQKHFGVSFLFCSATQPAFRRSANLKHGFQDGEVTPVIAEPAELFRKLQRVNYNVRPLDEHWDWQRLAKEMLARPQGLAVVNLRQHALDAFNALKENASLGGGGSPDDSIFHLSSAMCPAHRLDILGLSKPCRVRDNILARLKAKLPCWVVSTQLIEAGVDIDFPVVFRAMGPLDSIVQSAGRCNREGKLKNEAGEKMLGEVIVFHPELAEGKSGLPPGLYQKATNITPWYLRNPVELFANEALFAKFYDELVHMTPTDLARQGQNSIQEHRANFNFRTVGERAKVIDQPSISVVVPYGRSVRIIKSIQKRNRLTRNTLRRMQRYMVNLRFGPGTLYERLLNEGRLSQLHPDLEIQVLDQQCYDIQLGIVLKNRAPEELFA